MVLSSSKDHRVVHDDDRYFQSITVSAPHDEEGLG